MKKYGLLTILLFVAIISAYSQIQYGTGLIDNLVEENQYNELERMPSLGSKAGELPFRVMLEQYCPNAQNQGKIGSCVGWATGYAALTISHAIRSKWSKTELNNQSFSAMFVYNQIKARGCYDGASLIDAGNFLKEKGNCYNYLFDPGSDCDSLPEDEIIENARTYAIEEFLAVFGTDAKNKYKIFFTKKSLADSIPVVIGFNIRKNFIKAEGPFWNPESGDVTPLGGHAMVVVGYDDKKQAFRIMNSWGQDWGENGFIWVKYDDYAKFCKYGYQYIIKDIAVEISEDDPEVAGIPVKGKFGFRYNLAYDDNEELVYETAALSHAFGYRYQLSKTDWEIGDQFQFVIQDIPKKRYVYAFSLDNKGLNVHYPRTRKEGNEEDTAYLGSSESPIRLSTEDIVIPTETSALTRQIEGADHICVLYAAQKIEDFKERLERMQYANEDFDATFRADLGDILVPEEDIHYSLDEISFNAEAKGDQTVVPVLITMYDEQ